MKNEASPQLPSFYEQIKNPPQQYTPLPFWFLNDRPDQRKIRTQLEDFLQKGVNGFVLHPRIGIPREIAYLSDAFFEAVRYTVEEAARLNMQVVLYDEGMYPSGSAHGMVVQGRPELAARGITLTRKPGTDPVIAALPDGQYLVYRFTGGTIRGIHFGEDDGEAGAPAAADILNPAAVERFLHLTHDRYYEELKEYFGTTVIGFFTDEPDPLGRNVTGFFPWAAGMEQELQEAGGCPAELAALFTGGENASTRLYHRLIKKRLRETFYKPLSQWCTDHHIQLMGHPAQSDDVEEELLFHVPGQDLILRRVAPETGGLREPDSVQAKLAADIARHMGRRRNANECFGVCGRDGRPWYFTGKDMKWYINWLGMRGVNLFIPHAFYYSVEGARSGERPPDVGPNNIWWPYYRYFSDYMKRLSFLMTDSINDAKVAVLCDSNRVPCGALAPLYENQIEFHYLPAALLKDGVWENGSLRVGKYRYLAVLDLFDSELSEPNLSDSKLPDQKQASETDSRAAERVRAEKAGETFLSPSERIRGEAAGVPILPSVTALLPLADSLPFRTLLTDTPQRTLRAVRLEKEGRAFYLLCNEGPETISTRITLPRLFQENCSQASCRNTAGRAGDSPDAVHPKLTGLDLWTGASFSLPAVLTENGISFSLTLPSCGLILVMAETEKKAAGTTEAEARSFLPAPASLPASAQNFSSETEDETAAACRLPFLPSPQSIPDWSSRLKLVNKENNQAEYRFTLHTEEEAEPAVFQVRGEEMAECFCNGSLVDVSFYSPHCFSLCGRLKQGANEIKILFTGNAANLFTDAQIPYGKEETTL